MVKIMSGFASGRSLKAPKGLSTRPTSARVREAVFSMLRPDLPEATVMELFAGSGVMGLQALSEGASVVYAYEKDPKTGALMKQNAREILSSYEQAKSCSHSVFKKDLLKPATFQDPAVIDCLKSADIVWIDPPYSLVMEFLELFLPFLACHGRPGVRVGLELSSKDRPAVLKTLLAFPAIEAQKAKKYGGTSVIFFSKSI